MRNKTCIKALANQSHVLNKALPTGDSHFQVHSLGPHTANGIFVCMQCFAHIYSNLSWGLQEKKTKSENKLWQAIEKSKLNVDDLPSLVIVLVLSRMVATMRLCLLCFIE